MATFLKSDLLRSLGRLFSRRSKSTRQELAIVVQWFRLVVAERYCYLPCARSYSSFPMHPWLAQRTAKFDSSGIRKVFDLAAEDEGSDQPLDRPARLRRAASRSSAPPSTRSTATRTATARRRASPRCCATAPSAESTRRTATPTATCSSPAAPAARCVLAMLALINPGDEVIIFDPYFVMYPALVAMVGGKPVYDRHVSRFSRSTSTKVAAAITPRTKLILFNSPANPTGVVAEPTTRRAAWPRLAARARHRAAAQRRNLPPVLLRRPAALARRSGTTDTLVIDGFSKTYGMTGWRLG